jgi:hypothetical protein
MSENTDFLNNKKIEDDEFVFARVKISNRDPKVINNMEFYPILYFVKYSILKEKKSLYEFTAETDKENYTNFEFFILDEEKYNENYSFDEIVKADGLDNVVKSKGLYYLFNDEQKVGIFKFANVLNYNVTIKFENGIAIGGEVLEKKTEEQKKLPASQSTMKDKDTNPSILNRPVEEAHHTSDGKYGGECRKSRRNRKSKKGKRSRKARKSRRKSNRRRGRR